MNNKYKVWWIPQVPMNSFYKTVDSLKEAILLLKTLADYDKFQFENNIKPDYCNAGGLLVWLDELDPDENNEKWCEWEDEETGNDIWQYMRNQ